METGVTTTDEAGGELSSWLSVGRRGGKESGGEGDGGETAPVGVALP